MGISRTHLVVHSSVMGVVFFLSLFVLSTVAALEAQASGVPALLFRESSAAWGIDFRHHHGGAGDFYMIETMGSGVVALDYDGDGDRDLLFVDSGPVPGHQGDTPRTRLFRNDGAGTSATPRFVDVTTQAGIEVTGYGMGATAGDVDGDGDLDLYVTAFGANQLLRNQGDGTFEDVTETAGVGDERWSASAAFGDVDGDGDLDLYVTNYVDFSYDKNPICGVKARQRRSYCHPDVYEGVTDRLYRNRGDGTFEDVSVSAGIATESPQGPPRLGKGLGVVLEDLDGDGRSDIYVANDMVANFQFQNASKGTTLQFDELAILTGTAVSDLGAPEAGMGIGIGDTDGNGYPDLLVTHLDLQTNAFYSNNGGFFTERRFASKLGESSLYRVGFGAAFADFDHDGDLDLAVANGHIIHNVEEWGTGMTYKQANQVFENRGDGTFREQPNAGLEPIRASRGLATADLDGDGDLDFAITNSNDDAEVYENTSPSQGRWLAVDFRGPVGGNTAGIGARAKIGLSKTTAYRAVRTGSSYLSQNDLTLHFGVGQAKQIDLETQWPGGRVVHLRGMTVDARVRVSLRGQHPSVAIDPPSE